jgi:hypothetical protein
MSEADESSGKKVKEPDPQSLSINYTKAENYAANFCRLMNTLEDIIIDFGVQSAGREEDVQVSASVLMSPFTAKRLHNLLGATLKQHEMAFGPIETNARKRASERIMRAQQATEDTAGTADGTTDGSA